MTWYDREPEMVALECGILRETADAILVDHEGEEIWLPKSQIETDGGPGDSNVEVHVPEWLALKKGMI